MRPLEIAQEADGIAVVTGGLVKGERVTTSNEYRLQPGTLVSVNPAADQKPVTAPSTKS
jgi:multidrug efflux system membrane fusion protein